MTSALIAEQKTAVGAGGAEVTRAGKPGLDAGSAPVSSLANGTGAPARLTLSRAINTERLGPYSRLKSFTMAESVFQGTHRGELICQARGSITSQALDSLLVEDPSGLRALEHILKQTQGYKRCDAIIETWRPSVRLHTAARIAIARPEIS